MKIAAILTSALLLVSSTYATSTVVSEEEFIAEVAFLEESQQQCNTYNNKCKKDGDCMKGGFGPCNACGQVVGANHYQRCYLKAPPTPPPTASPTRSGLCGKQCMHDKDCKGMVGTFNLCTKCSRNKKKTKKGTMYQCYDPHAEDADEWEEIEEEVVGYLRTN